MSLSLSFYLVASLAVLVTGISKSGIGGGLGVLAVPLMTIFVPPKLALAVMMPLLLAMDLMIVWRYRSHWSAPLVTALLPGALLGLSIGASTLQWFNADTIKLSVGAMALAVVFQHLCLRREVGKISGASRGRTAALGLASGFASFVAHAGGPPVKGFLLRQRLTKTEFVATNTVFFFVLNTLKAASYAAMGQYSTQSLMISAMLSPLLVLGVFLGFYLHGRLDQARFVSVVYFFLAIAGVKLLWDGVVSLFR